MKLKKRPPVSMRSFAQTIRVTGDPAGIEEYKKFHRNSFPEVLKALREVGVLKMKIFILPGSQPGDVCTLFMYFETASSDKLR